MRKFMFYLACALVLFGGSSQVFASNLSEASLSSQISRYLENKNSSLAPYGNDFVKWGKRYGVDPRFLVAISGAETSFATYGPSQAIHNAWGIGPGWSFSSWSHGIKTEAEILGRYYRGRNISEIRAKWAPSGASNDPNGLNEHWVKNVSHYYADLGGDPKGDVFKVPNGGQLPVKDEDSLRVEALVFGSALVSPVATEKRQINIFTILILLAAVGSFFGTRFSRRHHPQSRRKGL